MSITTPQNDAVVEALNEASEGGRAVAAPRRRQSERPRKVKVHYNKREALAGYLFISPWIVGFLVFTAGRDGLQPGASRSATTTWRRTRRSPVGFDNYAELVRGPEGGALARRTPSSTR